MYEHKTVHYSPCPVVINSQLSFCSTLWLQLKKKGLKSLQQNLILKLRGSGTSGVPMHRRQSSGFRNSRMNFLVICQYSSVYQEEGKDRTPQPPQSAQGK